MKSQYYCCLYFNKIRQKIVSNHAQEFSHIPKIYEIAIELFLSARGIARALLHFTKVVARIFTFSKIHPQILSFFLISEFLHTSGPQCTPCTPWNPVHPVHIIISFAKNNILLHDHFEGCNEIAKLKGQQFFIPRGEAPRDEKLSPAGFSNSIASRKMIVLQYFFIVC